MLLIDLMFGYKFHFAALDFPMLKKFLLFPKTEIFTQVLKQISSLCDGKCDMAKKEAK